MTPTVGLIVHFKPRNPEKLPELEDPQAAIITKIPKIKASLGDPYVGLAILGPSGLRFDLVPY